MYVITDLDVGGAERSLQRLVLSLDREEFQPVVTSLTRDGAVGALLRRHDIPVRCLGMNRIDVGAVGRLAKMLRDDEIEILHSFLFHANIVGRLAARLAGTKIVISSIRVAEPRRHHLWAESWTHRFVHRFTCVSESLRDYIVSQTSIPRRKLVVIPNGVDISEFREAQPVPRETIGLSDEDGMVLFVGRLDKQKGVTYLLKAAARVVRQSPKVHFVIAGAGRLEGRLKRYVRWKKLADNVHFVGFRDDLPSLMKACDMFVCPSLWEGMPNVILEAMACAKPVIATRVVGCVDLVKDGETGLLVPPRDASALADAIFRLFDEPDAAASMGAAGLQRVREHFTVELMVNRNISLYRQLLSWHSPRRRMKLWRAKTTAPR